MTTKEDRVRDAAGEEREWPLISVLTRTYNRRELFAAAAASVYDQSYPHVEYVVVNDGGKSVEDILEPYQERLQIVYLEPGRVGRCRAGNVGLEAASGTWFAYLDDDDCFEPWHLETLLMALEGRQMKVGYSDAWQVDLTRDETGAWKEVGRTVPYSEDFDRLKLFQKAFIHIVTFMHHREVFDRLGGFDESLEVLEDWDLFFRYAQDYDFLHVPKVTARFHVRDDQSNAITMYRKEFVETRARLFAKYSNIAFRELMALVEAGRAEVGRLQTRIEALEEEMRHLRGTSP